MKLLCKNNNSKYNLRDKKAKKYERRFAERFAFSEGTQYTGQLSKAFYYTLYPKLPVS